MQRNSYDRYSKYSYYRNNINSINNEIESLGVDSLAVNYSYSSPYYKQKNKKQISITILIFLIIILLAVAVFLIERKEKKTYFYFLQANEFVNYKDATNLASEIQARQGAGYIYYDGTYHVLISYYSTKEEAESVLENVKSEYSNASVFDISASTFRENTNYTDEENKEIKNMILTNEGLIERTYTQVLSYDKNEISINILQTNTKKILDEYEKKFENFKNKLKNNKKYAIFLKKTTKIHENYKNLYEYTKNEFQPYQLKYELASIVNYHVSFLSCLW